MPEKEKVPGELADASQPIALPPERANDQWSQPGGEANNAPGNLVLNGGIHQSWSADAGVTDRLRQQGGYEMKCFKDEAHLKAEHDTNDALCNDGSTEGQGLRDGRWGRARWQHGSDG